MSNLTISTRLFFAMWMWCNFFQCQGAAINHREIQVILKEKFAVLPLESAFEKKKHKGNTWLEDSLSMHRYCQCYAAKGNYREVIILN